MENEENKELYEVVEKKFNSLTKSSQDLLVSEELLESMRRISSEEKISVQDGIFFENAIFGVLLGLIRSDEFIEDIKKFNMSEDSIKSIISRVDSEILKPMKKMLATSNLNSNSLNDSTNLNESKDDPYREKIN